MVNETSTGSISLKDFKSHPETPTLLLAMPREAAAVGAAPPPPSDTTIHLAEEGSRPMLRKFDADCHNRPVGWEDGSSWSSSRHEEGRVVPREPNPINDVVIEVVSIRA